MTTVDKLNRASPILVLFIVTVFSTLLVPVIALHYSYNNLSFEGSIVGIIILSVLDVSLWSYRARVDRPGSSINDNKSIAIGLALGLLWIAEISVNNFIAPPFPMRDVIDDLFWAAIAFSIFVYSILSAFRANQLIAGIQAGTWSGLASGAVACCMALSLIVFGMRFITHDPLNVAEWAARGKNAAPSMEAYFAFETFAGAFLHLVVLGLPMGFLLGALGGALGKMVSVARKRA